MAEPLKTISIRLPEDRHRQLKWLAKYRGMPPAVMIRSMIYQDLDQAGANLRGMQEIMREMDRLEDLDRRTLEP